MEGDGRGKVGLCRRIVDIWMAGAWMGFVVGYSGGKAVANQMGMVDRATAGRQHGPSGELDGSGFEGVQGTGGTSFSGKSGGSRTGENHGTDDQKLDVGV